uniref:Store-operated calcium entry-associated regulatory factor n=1 Tax=Gouania willdenowi TaxID=441366 RepID=A0A8C5D2C2_GOUWI
PDVDDPLFLQLILVWDRGVLLRDVQVLTLHGDRYTTARRSSPIPQLRCVGGSAGCHAFVPQVVQCVNKGWDGVDVQWECRTDMDNAYRFGHIEVSCEGYQNPSDPHVLKGSCGLEYTLELTEEGRRGRSLGGVASGVFGGFSGNHQKSWSEGGGEGGGLLAVAVLLLLAFGVYKLFLSGNANQWGPHPAEAPPPQPGFKPEFTGYTGANTGANTGYTDYTRRHHYPQGFAAPNTGGGFWTGMGAGGVLGYLLGQQRYASHMRGNKHQWYMAAASLSGTRLISALFTTSAATSQLAMTSFISPSNTKRQRYCGFSIR